MYYINGIQQVGIGVANVYEAWQWYLDHFGFDLPVFDEAAVAGLMLPYTDGEPRKRHAVLALNYQGGGGLEIWNHTSFDPRKPIHDILPGDLGIAVLKIKVKDVAKAYEVASKNNTQIISALQDSFLCKDPYNNIIEVIKGEDWHADLKINTGGVAGCTIGVSNMDSAKKFYKEILGFDMIISEQEGRIDKYSHFGDAARLKQVILKRSQMSNGAFSKLLGGATIELISSMDRKPNKIYEGRMWGELGYIHLCFDVNGMDALKANCDSQGCPFTVDSADSFDMGEAAGRFAYTEDPDGTLIEFVETHKIPILKKIGWYYDLRKRPIQKPLPSYLLKAMSLTRVKKALKK